MLPTTIAAGERIAGREKTTAELLNVRAVADMLGASPRSIYRLVDGSKMPRPVKLGALVRWRRAEILAWVAQGCPSVRPTKGGAI